MLIAIPSKGRAGETTSDKLLTCATMFVPELEAEAYRQMSRCEVRAVPDNVIGITATRNWILEEAERENVAGVVFVDDDVKAQGWVEMFDHTMKHRPMTESEWLATFGRLFEVCHGTGFPVFGVSTDGAPRSVYTYKPFLFASYVTASCMGVLPGIRFDESFKVKEDYELCLRCVRDFGGVVAARFCYWANDHWHKKGGCNDYRTQLMELETIGRLMKAYPGQVRRVTRGGAVVSIELTF